MGAVKHSRQRDAIKTFLMSRKDHPTADVVYTFVKNDFPSISLGTVYRNLSFLVEHGEAVTVPCEDGFVHYDANTKPHLHFQCRRCKCLIDITIHLTMKSLKILELMFHHIFRAKSRLVQSASMDCVKNVLQKINIFTSQQNKNSNHSYFDRR